MFTPQQLADLSLFNSMQAMTMAQVHGTADAERQRLAAELTEERNRHAALLEQFDSLNADYDRVSAEVAALNEQIEALRTLHAAQLAEAQQSAAVPLPPGVYLDGNLAQPATVIVAAAEPAPAEGQPWHVTGE